MHAARTATARLEFGSTRSNELSFSASWAEGRVGLGSAGPRPDPGPLPCTTGTGGTTPFGKAEGSWPVSGSTKCSMHPRRNTEFQ